MSDSYPEDWDSRRRKVYQRDGYRCRNCDRKGGANGNLELHAHHVVPKSQGGSDETENLITLCKHCHDAAHGRRQAPSRSKEGGILRRWLSLLFGSSKPATWKEAYDDADKDNDGYVRLGKSGKKGYFQRKVDKRQNKRHGGCPACDEQALTVSWIGLEPGSKVKVTECEACGTMYEEFEKSGTYQLRPIDSPDELDPSSSALEGELRE